MSPFARPSVQVAMGAVGAAIALPYFWFSGIFGSYFQLFLYVAPAVILSTLFIQRTRWYALGALVALAAAIAYIWATAGSSVPALPG